MSTPLSRRAALAGIGTAVSTAALAIPAAHAAHIGQPAAAPEHPNDKVRRLSHEIMDALSDPDFIGFRQVTITPTGAMYVTAPMDIAPEDRIEHAIQEIITAFAAMYPGWRPQVCNEAQRCLRSGLDGQLVEAETHRHAVLVFAGDESQYAQEATWFVSYPQDDAGL